MRIVFKQKKCLESLISLIPNKDALIEIKTKYHHYSDNAKLVACVMLGNISPELQIEYENIDAYIMIKHLRYFFIVKGCETSKELFPNMTIECPKVNIYVMFMIENYLTTSYSSS